MSRRYFVRSIFESGSVLDCIREDYVSGRGFVRVPHAVPICRVADGVYFTVRRTADLPLRVTRAVPVRLSIA